MKLSYNLCDNCKQPCETLGSIEVKFNTIPPIDFKGDICVVCAMELNEKLSVPPTVEIKQKAKPIYRSGDRREGDSTYMGGIGDH